METVIVRRPQPNDEKPLTAWCRKCGAPTLMIKPDQAATLARVSTRTIYRWVETDQLHFIEPLSGRLLICQNSLAAAGNLP
jgi:hypothetical protein